MLLSAAPSGLGNVNAHNRGLGSLGPGYSPPPLQGGFRVVVLNWG